MRQSSCAVALLACWLVAAGVAQGQQVTEQFIPIGKSPGLSGRATVIGAIEAVDAAARTVTVSAAGVSQKMGVGERTWIWIDRSRSQQSNLRGSMADLQPGRRVEVKLDAGDRTRADWIKVEAAP